MEGVLLTPDPIRDYKGDVYNELHIREVERSHVRPWEGIRSGSPGVKLFFSEEGCRGRGVAMGQ